MNELKEGVKLNRVAWPDDDGVITAGENNVEGLVVRMQPGQEAFVPWVEISYSNKANKSLVNCAFLEGVDFV